MQDRISGGQPGPGSSARAAAAPVTSWADVTGYVEPGAGAPGPGVADAAGSPGAKRERVAGGELGPAGRIGRYSVLRELGRGGMGVTYVAYDEDLDRRVAIKLVRSDAMDEQAKKRLQREARALARLAHPNIVAVHDVGSHGAESFIAMELVPGKTVNAWLGARPRAWAEVLSVFRQAGQGLRAAHEAGLVHRDIKPANIIVGDDGRVRVLDFGLAALASAVDEHPNPGCVPAVAMDEHLTDTESLMGTLAYMAPEHLDRGLADARSDQFAFCVSLFEALYGSPPFAGSTPRGRLAMMRQGAIAAVPGAHAVPGWLHAVVVRGLAYDPEARWPSMDALLAELTRGEIRPGSRGAGLAVAGMAALAAAAVAVSMALAQRDDAVCTGAQAEIDEVWNPQQRAQIAQAMLATGVPYAAETWQRTGALLDRYADAWVAGHTDACEDTAVRAEQSEAVRDQRMQCLSRRRRSLRALVGELARIDAASIARATEAAGHLPLIDACADPEHLGSVIAPPADPGLVAQIEALEAELSLVEQLQELGRYEQGRALAQAAALRAPALGHAPLEARARLLLGMLQLAGGLYQPAEASLKQAHLLARRSGEHEAALQAATQLVFLLGAHVGRLDDAEDWGHHVHAELPWVSAEAQQASSMNTLGVLALLQGKHGEALELCRLALALWEQALGPEHPENANALNNLGLVRHAQGKPAESAAHHARALAIRERALGPEHPRVARSLNNLGGALHRQGRYDEAAGHYVRALAIAERELGAEHPLLVDPLTGLALSYVDAGRADEALPLAGRALAVVEAHDLGADTLAEARFVLARALMATGRDPQRARALAGQARDAMRAGSGSLSLIEPAAVDAWLAAHAEP